MGRPDRVRGIISPYDDTFHCWGEGGNEYLQRESVPPVGVAETYAIRLNAPPKQKPKYLWVHDLKITAVMAHQPIEGKSVFSKWGEYLGTGGGTLQEPRTEPVKRAVKATMDIIDKHARPKEDPELPAARQERRTEVVEHKTHPPIPVYRHEFVLREDWKVTLELPTDLTAREAARLSEWVRVLSFQSE